jgi:hypothetical protein
VIKTATCLRETHQERWGAKTPTFPDECPGGRSPLRPKKSPKLDFHPSAPFGTNPWVVAKPYELMFGAMDVTKPYEFVWFGTRGCHQTL